LHDLGHALAGRDAVLDGEIVAFDDAGVPSFERLQERMHVGDPAQVALLVTRVPVVYMVFDLVALDGEVITNLPYRERRALLTDLPLDRPSWRENQNTGGAA